MTEKKALGNVKWRKIFEVLKKIEVTLRDRTIVWKLHKNVKAVIRNVGKSEEAEIKKVVRQGCSLSRLMHIYRMHWKETDGIITPEERINMLRLSLNENRGSNK